MLYALIKKYIEFFSSKMKSWWLSDWTESSKNIYQRNISDEDRAEIKEKTAFLNNMGFMITSEGDDIEESQKVVYTFVPKKADIDTEGTFCDVVSTFIIQHIAIKVLLTRDVDFKKHFTSFYQLSDENDVWSVFPKLVNEDTFLLCDVKNHLLPYKFKVHCELYVTYEPFEEGDDNLLQSYFNEYASSLPSQLYELTSRGPRMLIKDEEIILPIGPLSDYLFQTFLHLEENYKPKSGHLSRIEIEVLI